MRIATEEAICTTFWEWLTLKHPKLAEVTFHIPNGGYRGFREARRFKVMGVRPGVSDYFTAYPIGGYAGLWIEAKTTTGKIRPEQKEWLRLMSERGYAAKLCRGLDAMIDVVEWYCEL